MKQEVKIKNILHLGLGDKERWMSMGKLVHVPLIEITPLLLDPKKLEEIIAHFITSSHVIITSQNTIDILVDYLKIFNISLEVWNGKETIAVGKMTAKKLEKTGIRKISVADPETAEGVISLIHSHPQWKTGTFFWPHSAKARRVIEEYCKSEKISLHSFEFYTPKIIPKKPEIDPKDFDIIIFTSPSIVNAFLELFGQIPQDAELIAIGPITQAHLNQYLNHDRTQ